MVTVGVGTEKGAFLLHSGDRRSWELTGPIHKGWRVTTFGSAPGGDHLLAIGSNWFGAAIHRSADLAEWHQIVDGPSWPDGGDRRLNNVWTIVAVGQRLFAGVDEAGLFVSEDDGAGWQPVNGLNEHATRQHWQPGLGGLAAHRILVDPQDRARMWVGISAVGVFHTADGGETWEPRNEGVEAASPVEGHPEIGHCVHSLVADPADADTIWRQDHRGVYRTTNGGDRWDRIEQGLPAGFGFPIVRDPATGALFVVPQESDEHRMPVDGRFRVYRSADGGDTWQVSGSGHPEAPTYAGVLRDAMDIDGLVPGGVYVGTTAGSVHVTADGGDTWSMLPFVLPRILSVKVLT